MSCLRHSIPGDIDWVDNSEVKKFMGGDASGRAWLRMSRLSHRLVRIVCDVVETFGMVADA